MNCGICVKIWFWKLVELTPWLRTWWTSWKSPALLQGTFRRYLHTSAAEVRNETDVFVPKVSNILRQISVKRVYACFCISQCYTLYNHSYIGVQRGICMTELRGVSITSFDGISSSCKRDCPSCTTWLYFSSRASISASSCWCWVSLRLLVDMFRIDSLALISLIISAVHKK